MKTPNEDILRKVRQWLTLADEDLRLVRGAMNLPDEEEPPYRLIAYHAQQCAEKCLKAFLVYHNVDFPYTYNIRKLLNLCREHATWVQTLTDAEELTQYAITARYPGENEDVTAQEAQRVVSLAEQVRNQVRAALKELGIKLSN